jgi:glycine C-acetyltransferase
MKESAYLLNLGTKELCQQLTHWLQKMMYIVYVDAHACIIDGVRLHMGNVLHTVIMI